MADSSSRKDIPPDQMFHLYFPDVDKIPKVTPSSRWAQPQTVLTHYDICNLYEKLCRRLNFPDIKSWSAPNVYRSGSDSESPPPRLAAYLASTSTWQSTFMALFRNIFDNVPYLDPDAPIIKNRRQNMGYGDSAGAGSYGTKTTWKASSITSEESEGAATATPHSIPEGHVFACVSDWRQDTKLKMVRMAPLPASIDTTIEAMAVAAATLPEGPARDQAIAELETARQKKQAQALTRLNDATAAYAEATEAYENAQREYATAAGERDVAEGNKTSADQAAQAGQDSCDAAKEALERAQQALAEATTDEEREDAQEAVNEAQETLNERLANLDELLAAQQEATEALQAAQQKYSTAEDKLDAATSKSEECLSEQQAAEQALQELLNNPDIIEHPTQAIYIPEHGLYYRSTDQFERIAGRFTVGSKWGTEKLRRYALLSLYPKLKYRFQGSDINNPWQGATSDQQARTLAILERVGTAGWDNKLEITGGTIPKTDDQPSYVYPVPPPMYTWNYWDHYKLPESWGEAPGIEDLRKVFLPPMPDTILAAHLYINQYPPDRTRMEEARNALLERADRQRERGDEEQAAALEQQAAEMMPSRTRPSIETGGGLYGTGIWKSPAFISQFFKSLFDWADRFRYTLFPLDLSAIAYTVNAEESGTLVETSTRLTELQYSDGTSSTPWDYRRTQTLTFTVQANGRGTGSQVLPNTTEAKFNISGPFSMTLPSVSRNVSGKTGQGNSSEEWYREDHQAYNNETTSTTYKNTYTVSGDLNATVHIRTSKFRPLTKSIGRVEAGRVTMSSTYTNSWQPDDTGSNGRPVAPKLIQRIATPNATNKEDHVALLTPGNMQFMSSCRLLVLVKVVIDIPPDAVTYDTDTSTTSYTTRPDESIKDDNSTSEAHHGKASSKVVAFRLLDLGTPDDKTGAFDADFDPATLTEGLALPSISGPGVDSGLASNVTNVVWKGYDDIKSTDLNSGFYRYYTRSSMLNHKRGSETGGSTNGGSSGSSIHVSPNNINISVDCQWAGLLIDWDFDLKASITQSPTKAEKVGDDVDDALDTIAAAIAMLLEDKSQVSAAKSRMNSLKGSWEGKYDTVITNSVELARELTDTANGQRARAVEEDDAAEECSDAISAEDYRFSRLSRKEKVKQQAGHAALIDQLQEAREEHWETATNLRNGAACREGHADDLQTIASNLSTAKENTIEALYTPVVDTADELQSDIDEMLPTLREKQSRLEEIKNAELPTLQTGLTNAAAAIERYTEQVQNAKDDVARYEGEVATADNDLGIAIANRTLAEQRLRDAESLPPDDEGQAEAIREAQQALQDAEQAVHAATETLQEATDNLAQANTRLEEATEALEGAKATEAELMAELQDKIDELDNLWNADGRAAVYALHNEVRALEVTVEGYNIECEAPHFTNAASFAQHERESENCWKEEE